MPATEIKLLAWEIDRLSNDETVRLFQRLIDSGDAWQLPGRYGRFAMQLIEEGHCMLGPEPTRSYWGYTVPSRNDVPPDAPGSVEYYRRIHDKGLRNAE